MDQSDFLQGQDQFAELCAALYERALHDLSWNGPDNALFLKRRLASLPYYVKRAAHALLNMQQAPVTSASPLQLDIQNASWHSRQANKPPLGFFSAEQEAVPESVQLKLGKWLQSHAALGLVMPLQVEEDRLYSVFLDSIDRIDTQATTWSKPAVHMNRFGWFGFDGEPLEEQTARLVKPTRSSISAACCGHQWSAAGRKAPRTLSLREVLLATTLNWPAFTSVRVLPESL